MTARDASKQYTPNQCNFARRTAVNAQPMER